MTWNEIYLWYGVREIAARTLRDLDQRMKDVGGDKVRAKMIAGRGGIFIYDSAKGKRINPDVAK